MKAQHMVLRTEPEQLAWIQWHCNRLALLDPDAAVLCSGVIKTHAKSTLTPLSERHHLPLYQQRSPLVSKKPGGATDEE